MLPLYEPRLFINTFHESVDQDEPVSNYCNKTVSGSIKRDASDETINKQAALC